ncbi:MAG: tryptophan-rich sensory protein [Planctomycetota bacterium]|nr:tryptophan-rich sensory protein [Planctomycetota bacterium]
MDWMTWYNSLAKPSWTPQPSTIGLIWSILYPIILATFIFVMVQWIRGRLGWKSALPFILNLAANLVFTPIQFTLRNLPLASIDILIVWGTIVWMIAVLWKRNRWVALAQVPYLMWVSTATVLQLSITVMNW